MVHGAYITDMADFVAVFVMYPMLCAVPLVIFGYLQANDDNEEAEKEREDDISGASSPKLCFTIHGAKRRKRSGGGNGGSAKAMRDFFAEEDEFDRALGTVYV